MTQDHRPPGAVPVPHDLFRSDLFPERERFDVWRESVLPLFDSVPEAPKPWPFAARVESFDLQTLFLARSEFDPLHFRRDRHHRSADGGDHLLVQLYTRGGYAGYNGDRPVCVETGDISLLDLGRPLDTRAPASANLSLVIPRDCLAEPAPGASFRHGTVLRAHTPVARILANHLLTVWDILPHTTLEQVPAVNRMLLGAVAGAFGRGLAPEEPVSRASERATLDAVRVYILHHLDSDHLSPAFLCRHFGCSRSQLYRLFEPLGGIAGYIRRQRLERCYQELARAQGRQRIVDIALRWGFDSQSHFSRLFRRAFQATPSEVMDRGRERLRQDPAGPRADALDTPAFHDWLRRL